LVYSGEPTKAALKNVVNIKCGSCTSVYPAALMSPEEKEGVKTIEVGSVVLATGFEDFEPKGIQKWGYGLDNVITQYQLARLLDPFGPTGGIVARPSDAKSPKKIVMVQCVGSRDPEYMPDCSKYCCMAAIKHAAVIKELKDPRADITILYSESEGSPLSVKESLACGIPVVANKVGDIPLIIKNGYNGYIIENDDIQELANAMKTIINNSDSMRLNCIQSITYSGRF